MSKLRQVLLNFGFETEEKQLALLENLQIAGYFEDKKIWQMVNLINYNSKDEKVFTWQSDEKIIFESIKKVVEASKGDTNILLNDLFENDDFSQQDVEDIIVYLGQNAFGRLVGQERNELGQNPLLEASRKKYLENAKKLGLIEAINPEQGERFDECWIQGASRLSVEPRMRYLKNLIDQGHEVGKIRLLTGERELWAQVDRKSGGGDLEEAVEEAKEFMINLAKKNNLKINRENSFLEKYDRTYLNYEEGESGKVTETMMAKEIFCEVFGYEINNAQVVDSRADKAGNRPTTKSCAQDTYALLEQRISNNDFVKRKPKIMIVSNQPYCKRQELAIANIFLEKAGKKEIAEFKGVGEANGVGVTGIHSELGSLIVESFFLQNRNSEVEKRVQNRPLENLLYSKRKNFDLEPCETIDQHKSKISSRVTKATATQFIEEILSQSQSK